jgi:DNA polymerase-3 subunit alpha
VHIEVNAKDVTPEVVTFVEKNVRDHPGRSNLKFTLTEGKHNLKVTLVTIDNGFEMNDEMSEFLQGKPEIGVAVVTN